jgi:TATA-binding protein-associated factor
MPTHTIHCALTQMFHDYKEAPWNFDTWKELTGVRHGLFPNDDEQLPARWTCQTSNKIGSYFDRFHALKTEDQKHKFSSAKADSQMVPGRQAWRDWVTKGWKSWNIHGRIIDVLRSEGLHPYALAAELNSWPDASEWVSLAIDPVGTSLFGEQCYSAHKERVDPTLRPTIKALITRTWIALYTSFKRSKA